MTFKISELQNEIFGPVSLAIKAGQSLVIGGVSGSGKTRFLRAVADLDPASGQVFLEGVERSAMTAFEWRERVRFVPATTAWWFDTVAPHFDNLEDVKKSMSALALPEKLLSWKVEDLSTGERQRLGFLRAIQDKPKVLLLDEPTSALDEHSTKLFELMIDKELERGAIVFLASHSEVQIKKYGQMQLTFEGRGRAHVSQFEVGGNV